MQLCAPRVLVLSCSSSSLPSCGRIGADMRRRTYPNGWARVVRSTDVVRLFARYAMFSAALPVFRVQRSPA